MTKKPNTSHEAKRFAPKLHIRKGDTVRVIAGADKGNEGEVLEIDTTKYRAVVEGCNIRIKHKKPTQDQEGGRIEEPAGIHISNLMLIDPKTGEASRIGRRANENTGKSERYFKKSGNSI